MSTEGKKGKEITDGSGWERTGSGQPERHKVAQKRQQLIAEVESSSVARKVHVKLSQDYMLVYHKQLYDVSTTEGLTSFVYLHSVDAGKGRAPLKGERGPERQRLKVQLC